MQCEGYLPTKVDEPKQYGVFTVMVKSVVDFCEDIQLREVTLQRCNDPETPRKILHFHYHKWPDHGCPRTTEPLRRLARAVAAHTQETSCGPPLVHCSAGTCFALTALPFHCLQFASGSWNLVLMVRGRGPKSPGFFFFFALSCAVAASLWVSARVAMSAGGM